MSSIFSIFSRLTTVAQPAVELTLFFAAAVAVAYGAAGLR